MRQCLGVPQPVLAELFGISKETIATAQQQIKPLLKRAGRSIEPATTQLTTLADLKGPCYRGKLTSAHVSDSRTEHSRARGIHGEQNKLPYALPIHHRRCCDVLVMFAIWLAQGYVLYLTGWRERAKHPQARSDNPVRWFLVLQGQFQRQVPDERSTGGRYRLLRPFYEPIDAVLTATWLPNGIGSACWRHSNLPRNGQQFGGADEHAQ
jgi:hypothetical protein